MKDCKFLVVSVIILITFDVVAVPGQLQDLNRFLLVYYDFEQMLETLVFDKSQNGRFARMYNTNIRKADGRCGKGIALNSKSRPLHIISEEDASKIKPRVVSNLQLTVAAWVFFEKVKKENDRTIVTGVLQSNSPRSQSWYFGFDSKEKTLSWSINSSGYKPTSNNFQLNPGVWQHVAVSYSFINGIENCTFFVNGTLYVGEKLPATRDSKNESTLTVQNPPLGHNILIGSINAFGLRLLNGIMDEFYIFNKTLSKREIRKLMHTKCQEHSMTTTPEPKSPKDQYSTITDKYQAKKFLSDFVDEQLLATQAGPNSAIDFTKKLEHIALTLTRNTLMVNQSQILETRNIFLLMTIPVAGFTFPSQEQQNGKNISEAIAFPDDLVQTEDGVQRAFVSMAYPTLHENMTAEFSISSDSFKPNVTLQLVSKIIGAAVDPPLKKPLKNRITIAFNHAQMFSGERYCSFWNHSKRTTNESHGEWSTQGCELDKNQSSVNKTVCLCNHLTNFALLFQRKGIRNREPPLSLRIITIIGCSLSILACLLCFIMFFTMKKKDTRHYLHINLVFAIAVAQLTLLFGITQTNHQILCKAMAALLHYFFLVAFLLMLSEGVHLAILIETAFSHGNVKLPVYLITSWGLPLVIVGITLGARYDNYGDAFACFISAKQGTVYAFVVPVALILVINFVVLVIVLRQVIKKTSLPISSKATSKFEIARATIRSLVILFPVMGFTWIFGILFFALHTLALEYIFAIFCSLQGFFIFLLQYVINTENRLAFVRTVRRWRLTSSSNEASHDVKAHTAQTKIKISSPDPQGDTQDVKSSSPNNCLLVVHRNVDDRSGGTLDSRTASTFI